MIHIDEIWLSTQPMDMRAGMDTAMAQVLRAFGSIKPHCAYLFCPHRGPGAGSEDAVVVEDGQHHREDAVEEDLRQQQERERGGQAGVDLTVPQVELGEQRRARHRDHRHHQRQHRRDGE